VVPKIYWILKKRKGDYNMKHITDAMIKQRIIDWDLDPDSDEDYYTASDSLHYENGGEPTDDIFDDGII